MRILNIDDDEAGRYVKTRILRGAGHDVLEAESGIAGLASLARIVPDAVVLDVKLPDMSGFAVARRIRADPRLATVAIVHTSTIAVTHDDEVDGLESGADVFLSQPVTSGNLVGAVEAAIRLRRAGAAPGEAQPRLDSRSLDRVQSFARARLMERLAVKDLADAAGLSEFHFARLFKAATAETPHAFITRLRIEESKRLLRSTPLSLGEIATRVGYRTQAHFSRAFRGATGDSPRDYRARHARTI